MYVRDYMSTDVITAHARDGVHQTFWRMHEHGIRHMPVVDGDDRLIGFVTERDLRRPEDLVDDGPNRAQYWRMDNDTKVGDAMCRQPAVTRADAPLAEPLEAMIQYRYGAMPVVDDGGKVVGIITTTDMMRALRTALER